jgi:hypothetical protein
MFAPSTKIIIHKPTNVNVPHKDPFIMVDNVPSAV